MKLKKLFKVNPFQEFRHRVYLPLFSLLGSINDFFRGVSTEKVIELCDVGIEKSAGSRSETISYGKLKSVLKFARSEGFDRLCDIGCGLGRSFIVGKEIGVSEFYGVDISSEIIDLCNVNLSKKGISADLKSCDVDDYSLPNGKLAIYLFNPFGLEKMNELVDKISKRDSDTLVIYFNPKHPEVFKESLKIKEIVWNHFGMYREMVYFYRFPPSS
jgi:hypothetical protein